MASSLNSDKSDDTDYANTDDTTSVQIPVPSSAKEHDPQLDSRFKKFIQFFIITIGFVYTGLVYFPIFILLIFYYGWFKISETSFNKGTYIFETLTYVQYFNFGKFLLIIESILALLLTTLGLWSFVKKRQSRFFGILLIILYIIIAIAPVGFLVFNWIKEEENLLKLMHDGFQRLFIRHFKPKDQYFENLKYFMDSRKCCGPEGAAKFSPLIGIDNSQYMPIFCSNSSSPEYKVSCYEQFTIMNREMFDYALAYILLGSAFVCIVTLSLYKLFLKSTSIMSKENRLRSREKVKNVILKSYIGKKLNNKLKK